MAQTTKIHTAFLVLLTACGPSGDLPVSDETSTLGGAWQLAEAETIGPDGVRYPRPIQESLLLFAGDRALTALKPAQGLRQRPEPFAVRLMAPGRQPGPCADNRTPTTAVVERDPGNHRGRGPAEGARAYDTGIGCRPVVFSVRVRSSSAIAKLVRVASAALRWSSGVVA